MAAEFTAGIQNQINDSLTKQEEAYGQGSHGGNVGFIIDTWHLSIADAEKAENYWRNNRSSQ